MYGMSVMHFYIHKYKNRFYDKSKTNLVSNNTVKNF